MNESFSQTFAASLSNVTQTNASETQGLTQAIYLVLNKIVEVLTTSGEFGFWKFLIILFAIVGFFAIIASIGNKILDGFSIIFTVFIILPAIFIVGIINRKKRKQRLSEWGEIKKDFKENSKKIKNRYWIMFILFKIVFPLLLIGLIIYMFF